MQLDELELLNRAKASDSQALSQIHDAYYDAIYRYLSFRVGDAQTAEDLTSEVFTRFLHALRDRHAPSNTIRGWLFGAASLVLKEHYRKKKRQQFVQLSDSIESDEETPEEWLEQTVDKAQLRAALTQLTTEQQQVLALRYGYEMPIKEVADTVNKSVVSVKMLQMRAIARLTQMLSGSEVA